MTDHSDTFKHFMDAGSAGVALLGIISHFAEVLSPILTVLLTVMSIIWLGIRFREWARTGRTEA